MSAEVASFLRGTVALDVMLLVALYLTLTGGAGPADPGARRRLAALAAVAMAVQGLHFAEEWATGFHELFPSWQGLEPWSVGLWAGFNFVWLGIWCLSLVGLSWRWRPALFPIWFLGVGCAANGVAHPLLALAVGGYFPGLWSSPIAGVVGVALLRRLHRFTGRGLDPAPAVGSS